MATKTFKKEVLARLNKDEKTRQSESITDKIEDFTLEAEAQISLIANAELPKAEAELKRAKRELKKGEKNLSEGYFNLEDGSYSSYISGVNNAKEAIESAKQSVANVERTIEGLNAQKDAHTEVLEKLKS